MNELDLDSFEISIKSDIKSIKPKSKRRGYAKELVEKLYSTIEQALADGCSFEQIVEVLSLRNIKISSSTLKRYHQANKKTKETNSQNSTGLGNTPRTEVKEDAGSECLRSDSVKKPSLNKPLEPDRLPKASLTEVKEHQNPVSQILSGSSLTDEDYADDFNDY
ncbi:MAG: hypothetical protein QNJ72_45610 [Pleurocapsa sp. MO_226.B13]|nr:hypothetical protein [Pleurocapsa sp. MO_226.B13]